MTSNPFIEAQELLDAFDPNRSATNAIARVIHGYSFQPAPDKVTFTDTHRSVKGIDMTPPPVSALDTAGNPPPLVSPQETRRARETAAYKRTIASRQNVDTQIKQLKSSINADLAYIRNCLNGGRKDKAVNQMIQVVRKQERLQELASKWTRLMAADAVKQALEGPARPAKNRFERPVKRYKLFDRD